MRQGKIIVILLIVGILHSLIMAPTLALVNTISVESPFNGEHIGLCGNELLLTGEYKENNQNYEALALYSPHNPDKPTLILSKHSRKYDAYTVSTLCFENKIMVFHQNDDRSISVYSKDLSPISTPYLTGISGTFSGDNWQFGKVVYLPTPHTDKFMRLWDGREEKPATINDDIVPSLVSMMTYPKRIFVLDNHTLLLIGQGGYIVNMTAIDKGRVISYINVDPSSGGYPYDFGREAVKVENKIYGVPVEKEHEKELYVFDITKREASVINISEMKNPYALSAFGNYLYILMSERKESPSKLLIYNVRTGKYSIKPLNYHYIDMVAYLGRVYLLKENAIDIIPTSLFTDMNPDHWAYNAAAYLVSSGVLSGYPDGSFKPDKPVSRAEYAKILATVMKLPLEDTCGNWNMFSDISPSAWYCPYVKAVAKAGYMIGVGEGKFAPNNLVKKEEIITTIVRINGWQLVDPPTPTFSDIDHTYWAYPYVETAVKHGIIARNDKGLTSGNIFGKGQPATRAMTAVLIYRGLYKK